jgi:hypothetical protein
MYSLYNVIICINYNNAVITNNYGRLQDLILLLKIPKGMLKNFFEIYGHFEHAPSKKFHQSWPRMSQIEK